MSDRISKEQEEKESKEKAKAKRYDEKNKTEGVVKVKPDRAQDKRDKAKKNDD